MKEFIDNELANFPNVQHRHVPGQDPILRMKSAQGQEDFNIKQFSKEDIVAFLKEKLSSE